MFLSPQNYSDVMCGAMFPQSQVHQAVQRFAGRLSALTLKHTVINKRLFVKYWIHYLHCHSRETNHQRFHVFFVYFSKNRTYQTDSNVRVNSNMCREISRLVNIITRHFSTHQCNQDKSKKVNFSRSLFLVNTLCWVEKIMLLNNRTVY